MKSKLVGFTVRARAEATCPNGHEFSLDMAYLIQPTDGLDFGRESKSLEYHIKAAHQQLLNHECETCAKNKRTIWR